MTETYYFSDKSDTKAIETLGDKVIFYDTEAYHVLGYTEAEQITLIVPNKGGCAYPSAEGYKYTDKWYVTFIDIGSYDDITAYCVLSTKPLTVFAQHNENKWQFGGDRDVWTENQLDVVGWDKQKKKYTSYPDYPYKGTFIAEQLFCVELPNLCGDLHQLSDNCLEYNTNSKGYGLIIKLTFDGENLHTVDVEMLNNKELKAEKVWAVYDECKNGEPSDTLKRFLEALTDKITDE